MYSGSSSYVPISVVSSLLASVATLAIVQNRACSLQPSATSVPHRSASGAASAPHTARAAAAAAVQPTADEGDPTHAPYPSEPPSFLSSRNFNRACLRGSKVPKKHRCRVQPWRTAASRAAAPCTPASLRAWNSTGEWYRTDEGHFRYEPTHCTLRRPTAAQARQCLHRKRLAYVGDSIMRYQYLSLMHFLALEVWPERWGANHEMGRNICLLESESDDNRDAFYRRTAELLSNASNAVSFETCDCNDAARREFHEFKMREFPLLRNGGARSGQLSACMYFMGPDFRRMTLRNLHAAIQSFGDFDVDGGLVLFNLGMWIGKRVHHFKDDNASFPFEPVFAEAAEAMPGLLPAGGTAPLLFWKSITLEPQQSSTDLHTPLDVEARHNLVPPWRLFDARTLTEQTRAQRLQLLCDGPHPCPLVHEEMNVLLLNMLCDEDMRFVK